jgi:hypothetical protein
MQGYLFAKPIPRQELEDTVCGPDAAWRIPIMQAESWCPSDLDLGPAPTSEPSPAPAEVVPEGKELVVELEKTTTRIFRRCTPSRSRPNRPPDPVIAQVARSAQAAHTRHPSKIRRAVSGERPGPPM